MFPSRQWPKAKNPCVALSYARRDLRPFCRGIALEQRVADLLEELHFLRGRRGRLFLLAAQIIHPLDHHEQRESHDQKGDHIIDEQAEIDRRRARLPRLRE